METKAIPADAQIAVSFNLATWQFIAQTLANHPLPYSQVSPVLQQLDAQVVAGVNGYTTAPKEQKSD